MVEFYNAYDLTRDDADAVMELASWPGNKEATASVQPKVGRGYRIVIW